MRWLLRSELVAVEAARRPCTGGVCRGVDRSRSCRGCVARLRRTGSGTAFGWIDYTVQNYDRLVVVVHGFNNGDGEDDDEIDGDDMPGRIRVDMHHDNDPHRLMATYWPNIVANLTREQVIDDRTAVLHVWWTNSIDKGLDKIPPRGKVAALPVVVPIGGLGGAVLANRAVGDLPTPAYFNLDYVSAHFSGRHRLAEFLIDFADAVPESRPEPFPITLIAESLGNRVVVSAVQRLSEDQQIAPSFATEDDGFPQGERIGKTPLNVIMIHPALRSIDFTDAWAFPPDGLFDPDLRLTEDEERAQGVSEDFVHPMPESPLVEELRLLRTSDPDRGRMLLMRSPFDKAGLAFLAAQRDNPRTGETGDFVYTSMLGRVGTNFTANQPHGGYSAFRAGMDTDALDVVVGKADGATENLAHHDLWHVILFGWYQPGIPLRSRHIFDRNMLPGSGTELAFEEQADIWFSNDALQTGKDGLKVQGLTDTPYWNQIRFTDPHLERVWRLPAHLIDAGDIPLDPATVPP